jgi:hypothetical protein
MAGSADMTPVLKHIRGTIRYCRLVNLRRLPWGVRPWRL